MLSAPWDLEGRWRILKSGIRVHNTEVGDNIWLTCCALHNMLLDVDGLSKAWKMVFVPLGDGIWRVSRRRDSFAVRRLVDPTGTEDFRLRHYDGSRFGYRRPPIVVSDNEEEDDDGNESDGNCSRHSQSQSQSQSQREWSPAQ
ncbi:Plant transposon protein [Fragilaria crotonensis]|nr:Plant transposon protein [Fragilaria crotonensis]